MLLLFHRIDIPYLLKHSTAGQLVSSTQKMTE